MSNANPRAREAELLRALADALERGRTDVAAQAARLLAGVIDGSAPTEIPRKGKRRPNTGA